MSELWNWVLLRSWNVENVFTMHNWSVIMIIRCPKQKSRLKRVHDVYRLSVRQTSLYIVSTHFHYNINQSTRRSTHYYYYKYIWLYFIIIMMLCWSRNSPHKLFLYTKIGLLFCDNVFVFHPSHDKCRMYSS